ncbi:hypothetical protein FGE12_14010 [Aggregicoccus sp. 17bor-14]|uniref:aspartyl protease family protein n=1 Tax=Myxococcaceae TaxID=31 RepID=UPI00129C8183|nr:MULTISPECIES: aspartyl protease family protein [Myxococcaceae]MBF5043509.1 aspartyl protease family protein [Simulacricoccus sp. 17bor-14]MRI89266.1 hypothetical protein [Aggregicoccus sp. 17bor-14]
MKRLALVLLLLFVALPGAAHAADPAAELLARHLAWRGGPAYARLKSVHRQGQLSLGGLSGKLETWSLRDGRLREDTDLGVLRGSRAFTPKSGWSVNASGQLEDVAATDMRDARHQLALEFGEALRGHGGARAQLLPDEPRDGRSWKVVRITFSGPGDEDRYDLFLDAGSGALHGVRIREDQRTRFVRLGDWREVEGVRMAFLEEVFDEHPDGNTRTVLEQVELNAQPPAGLFERPKEAERKVRFAEGRHSTGFLPFEFFNENRVYIPAKVNGRDTQVLLDSGAEMTVVDAGYARELGLAAQGTLPAVGSGGQDRAQLAAGVDILLGDLQLKGLTVAIIDLAQVAKEIGHPLPVVLGKEAFNQLVVDVDFPNRRIAFHEPRGFQAPAGAVKVPLKESTGGMREVQISVEGRPPVPVLFDVGNGGALSLYAAYWKRAGLLEGRRHSRTLSGAVGGLQERDVAVLGTVRLAGVTFHDVPTVFDGEDQSVSSSSRNLGNLGLQVLGRFRMITDYARDTMLLVPDARAVARPFDKDRAGLALLPHGEYLEVLLVSPGSPAAAAGWKKGERVVAIDGQRVAQGYSGTPLAKWRYAPAGKQVSLTLADGTTRSLTLQDYY